MYKTFVVDRYVILAIFFSFLVCAFLFFSLWIVDILCFVNIAFLVSPFYFKLTSSKTVAIGNLML